MRQIDGSLRELTRRVGDNLKYLRELNSLPQEKLANLLGYSSQSFIANIESGGRLPTIKTLYPLAQYFNVPVGAFFDYDFRRDKDSLIKVLISNSHPLERRSKKDETSIR